MLTLATPLDRLQRRVGAVLLVGLAVLLLALGGRLVYVHTALGAELRASAERLRRGTTVIPARRGMVLDARGRVAAVAREVPDVFVDPALVENVDELAAELSARLNLPAAEIAAKIRDRANSRYVVVATRVDEVAADAVRGMEHVAVGLTDRSQRVYPLGSSMAHALGWVGRDGKGMAGLERAFDDHLRGRDGRRGTIRDARRRALRRSNRQFVPPVDGGHLVLTLDAEIQRMAESALAKALTRFEAQSGVVIVMSPRDGSVVAMVSQPGFDPNAAVAPGDLALRRNRAVTDPVEPGSSFKPIITCGALDGGFVSLTERIDCRMGSHYFGRRLITDTSPHGLLDLRGIITHSSNIGMGFIAHRMGNAVLHETIRRFGFGQLTGIECPGEGAGLVYPLPKWTSYSTNSVVMGYEILVTPLQLANAFSAIVNGGILLRPRIVSKLLAPDGSVIESYDSPQIVRRVASSAVARVVAQDLLVSVVENGGGRRAKVGPYSVLGKTGTARLTYADRGGYEPGAYLSVFVGAAPAHDPRLVALAMVRRPRARLGYFGATVAAPVVGEILANALAYLGVEPRETAALTGL